MPIDYSVDHVKRRILCVWAPPLDGAEIVATVERAAAEGLWTYGMLHDGRAVQPRGDLKARDMVDTVTRLAQTHGPRGPVALVANVDTIGSAQAYAILNDQSGQSIQVFWDRDAAEAWLDRQTPQL